MDHSSKGDLNKNKGTGIIWASTYHKKSIEGFNV
jgi:hypothetical protein